MNGDKLTVLVVEPMKAPYVKRIADDLHTLQSLVGGNIEAVYPFSEPVALICNEEGKMLDLPPNRFLRLENGEPYDIVCGTFFLVGTEGDKFVSLTEDSIKEYQTLYNREMIVPWPKKMQDRADKSVSYIEWLRQRSGQPTFRAMLEADLREAIEDANDMGHFFLIMEHKGYEIKHGNRLGFCLRGQERFMIPGRKNKLFTEDGIRSAIAGNLDAIEAGTRPAIIYRPQYQPYRRHPKYTGFMALYAHYLYLLGKIGQRQYPPKMTPHLRKEIMKFENYKAQFAFLREHGVTTADGLDAVRARTEETLATLIKKRTILNVRKKKRKQLFDALADVDALAPAKQLYEDGISGMEEQFAQCMDAVAALEQCGIPRELLAEEKAALYQQLAEINREIRLARQKISMCKTIEQNRPQMERDIQVAENMAKEVERDEHRRR